MGRTRKVIEERTLDDEDELAEVRLREREMVSANDGVTIFDLSSADEKHIDRVHVFRKDPDEGFLADVAPTITEQEILARWGGSTFRLEGKNSLGRIVKVRQLSIAGDPVFVSEIFEARWRRANGLRPRADGSTTQPDHMSAKDMILMMTEQAAQRRQEERERLEAARRDELEREERRRKDQEERDERRRKDEHEREDRNRKLRAEEEDRRRLQHKEDMERATSQSAMVMQQQAQMFQATIQMMKVEGDKKDATNPVDMLTKGIELAVALRGDGDGASDPMAEIAKRLPEILGEVRQVGGAIVEEVRGRKAAKGMGGKGGKPLTITGPLAEKLRTIAQNLKAQGKDPETELEKLATYLLLRQQQGPKAKEKPAEASKPAKGRYTPPRKRRPPQRKREAPAARAAVARQPPVSIVRPIRTPTRAAAPAAKVPDPSPDKGGAA